MTTGEHVTSVHFQKAWSEWRPECTCGWVGSYLATKWMAEAEANLHLDTKGVPL